MMAADHGTVFEISPASMVAGPADIPGTGRFAVLVDPQGAAFALFKG